MVVKAIDAETFKKMFLAGAASIEEKKDYINELNVFPVPDGDTGTNMSLTIMAAVKEVNGISDLTIKNVAKAISGGSLRGARGNSGVILSQLFRGFTKEIQDYDTINVTIMANALQNATETAYRAVMKPKEGTILTVAKGAAEKALDLVSETEDMVYFMQEVIKEMDSVLAMTPELLPVLKEAGVVDAGGQGLLEIAKGAFEGLMGKEVDFSDLGKDISPSKRPKMQGIDTADIKFGYCTEFIIMLEEKYTAGTELQYKAYLESIGDSIVVVSDDGIVKVHVHTNDPGLAIQKGLRYGSLTNIKIDNMREEHNQMLIKNSDMNANAVKEKKAPKEEARKKDGFIAVSIGEGFEEIFTGLGVDCLIEGGQTMNPSTEDMLNAISQVNADNIYIFPNNGNIILAAEQAKELTDDKNIVVIPTKTVPQGIAAVISYIHDKDPEENKERMINEMSQVKSGQVTYSVRDTTVDGIEIKQGDLMGIGDKVIYCTGEDMGIVTLDLLENLVDDGSEIISIYYGEEVDEEDANQLGEVLEEKYPDIDIEVNYGGQPIYYYLLSVE